MFSRKIGSWFDIASDGDETNRIYRAVFTLGLRFDVVIADLSISGVVAMSLIFEIDPSARGIVSSGYSEVPVFSKHGEHGINAVLKNPFTFDDFRQAI